MSDVRIRFENADMSLAIEDSFITRLVSTALGHRVTVSSDRHELVDAQISSVQYPMAVRARQMASAVSQRVRRSSPSLIDARWSRVNPKPQGRARAHIWFTGENVRPPSTGWDATLSFDLDPLGGRNAYLPLWWYSIGLLGPARSIFMDPAPAVGSLLCERKAHGVPRDFVVAFINHPHPMRFHAIQALSRFGKVDVFGRAVGRPVINKVSLAGRYKFMLCFENDLYPGYVTEKAIEAWGMGTIPLWWGSDPAGYLNPQAMINAASYSNLDLFAEAVAGMSRQEELWLQSYSSALLLRPPDLDPALNLIRKVIPR